MQIQHSIPYSCIALGLTLLLHGLLILLMVRDVEEPPIKKSPQPQLSIVFMAQGTEQQVLTRSNAPVASVRIPEPPLEPSLGQYALADLDQVNLSYELLPSPEQTQSTVVIDPLLAAQLRAKQAIRRAQIISDQYQLNPEKIDESALAQLNINAANRDQIQSDPSALNSAIQHQSTIEIYPFVNDQDEIEQLYQILINQPQVLEDTFQQQIVENTSPLLLQELMQEIDELIFMVLPAQSRLIVWRDSADSMPSDVLQAFLTTLNLKPFDQLPSAQPYLIRIDLKVLSQVQPNSKS